MLEDEPGPGRWLLFFCGVAVLAFSFADLAGGAAVATTGLVLGGAMVILACLIDKVKKLSVKSGGVEVETREDVKDTTSQLADSPVQDRFALPQTTVGAYSYLTGSFAIQAIFNENKLLSDCRFHLYLPDQTGAMAAVLEPEDAVGTPETWSPERGVVGRAWREDEYVLAVGEECYDDTHNLTAEQQERYRDHVAVAAAPVRNGADRILGVVSAGTTDSGTRLASDPEGYLELVAVANLVARVLVDVLKWFTDEDDG